MIVDSASGLPPLVARPVRPGTRVALRWLVAVACAGATTCAFADGAPVQHLLEVPVSRHQLYTAHTPIAVRDGAVYMATLESGPSGSDASGTGDLRTVVRRGVPTASGNWEWTATVIEDRSVADAWHTAPSVGIDETGRVHVAYNMHNLPWQYAVSREPGDIDAFDFRGQRISQRELDRYRLENRTSFPDLGTAAIPGNQITYPAFVNDRSGRLHVTYRFAAKPARAWEERTLSSGLARYDAATGTWEALGAELSLAPGDHDDAVEPTVEPRALASATGWTSYLPRVTFGPDDAPTVSLLWRAGGPGAKTTAPCALRGDPDGGEFTALDGAAVTAPALPGDCPPVSSADAHTDYYSIGDAAADAAGRHHVLLSPEGGMREIHAWTGEGWTSEPAPGAAVEIFFDPADNLWAVTSDLTVYVRRAGTTDWERVAEGAGGCYPHAELDTDGRSAFLFALGCGKSPTASVTRLDLEALLGEAIVPVMSPATQDEVDVPDADPGNAERSAAGTEGTQTLHADDNAAVHGETDADATVTSTSGPLGAPLLTGVAPDGGAPPLVLPWLEWRALRLPESSLGLTAASVFAELPGDTYGVDWALYGFDPVAGAYFVPSLDEAVMDGHRYWAIQAVADVVVVELARAPSIWE